MSAIKVLENRKWAISILKEYKPILISCGEKQHTNDLDYKDLQWVGEALDEALLALEQKEKFVKILRDINYLMEGKYYIEVISFTNKWIKELEEGVEK